MATVKKAQKGAMTMKQLKMKYPSVDTTAKGDVRGSEMNAYAPKKELKKYNDTYNAFEKKFGNKPAKDKKGGVVKKKMKIGGSVKKAQYGAGTMTKTKSPGGSYVTKVTRDPQGNVTKAVERRTLKGLVSGAPKAKGVMARAFKKGGKMSKMSKKK